jgi:DNA gyrase subunit B
MNGHKKMDIQRFKGLAEMEAEQLWESAMNPETRVLKRVTVEDAASADRMFSILMGEDVEARREFIQQNAKEAFIDA